MASAWSQLDQLLTCAICLDRYRNPKLLPCQHTFCMEPCLDGLIDYARRQIKCPECRAEHRIPYQGIQQFPTNVTLMRFLELHRDITGEEPEPPPSLMERCNVCSEKANVERCAHCDKKICPDCKDAHVDILRREINRINNQVRRGLHRLSEALTQTKKNADKLQLNCNQVREEIDDIVKRYSRDLKVTEDKLKRDLEMYTEKEMKSLTKLKEDLEIEVNNISSNCELVDKYIKDDSEWSDVELLEYKQIFLKMLDFLRMFDHDSTDFTRRIKFQPRADPDVLHRNVADFGELKINSPINAIPTQQSLMPSSNALMRSQSDHRLAAQFARRADINQREDRPTSPLSRKRDSDRYSGRYSERSRDYDYPDRVSTRYSREDTALSSRWRDGTDEHNLRNRFNRDNDDCDVEPHQSRTVRFADENRDKESVFDIDDSTKGPLSGIVKLVDSAKIMVRLHQNEVRQKQQTEKENTTTLETNATPTNALPLSNAQVKRQTSRQQSEDDIDRQKRANQQAGSSSANASEVQSADLHQRRSSVTEPSQTTEVETSTAQKSDEAQGSRTRSSDIENSETDKSSQQNLSSRFTRSSMVKVPSLDIGETSRKLPERKVSLRAATPVRHIEDDSDSSDEEEDDNADSYETANSEPVKMPTQTPFLARQRRLPEPEPRLLEMHESDEDDNESDETEESETEVIEPSKSVTVSTNDNICEEDEEVDDDDDDDEEQEEDESDEIGSEASDDQDIDNQHKNEIESLKEAKDSTINAQSSEEEDDSDDLIEEDDKTLSTKFQIANVGNSRSTQCDSGNHCSRFRSEDADVTDSSSASSATNYQSLSRNTTPLVTSSSLEDKSPERNNTNASRFRRRPFLPRSKSSHELASGIEPNIGDDDEQEERSSKPSYRSRFQRISSEDNPSRTVDTSPSSNSCWAKYLNNKYGSNATGRVVPRSKSSHSIYRNSESESDDGDISGRDSLTSSSYGFPTPRSAYMQKKRMLLKIGSRGSESGNFVWPRGVAVGPENSIVVADSSNHRVQVFDSIGKFLFEFGSYGSGVGQFDCLAGVSVNRIGQFIVSDRYNHRVQLFDQTGRFLRAFGCEGRTDGRFNYPWGIATDSMGFIYICDKENHRIQVFQADGSFVGKFGSLGSRPGQLEHPHYIAVTSTNRVVVGDTNNHRVQIFDVNGRSLASFGIEGSDGGCFKFPKGIAVDDQGFIIVADSGNNRIQVFQPDGTFLKSFGCWGDDDGEFKALEGIAVTSGGSIVACDRENHRVQVF